jgi:hypothetical protein
VIWRRGVSRARRSLGALAACGLLLVAAAPAQAATPAPVTPGTSFTISTEVHAAPSASFPMAGCPGPTASLVPGVTHCLVYRVDNHLDVPITVRTLTMRLDPAYPAPPVGCSADALELPEYSGALVVPARASAVSPGLPIALADTAADQGDCQQTTLHFVYGGSADAADDPGSSGGGILALTGADLPREAALALVLTLLGLGFVVTTRRRARGRRTR